MAKVEMSIQEYDSLRQELSIYEEIVNAMTSPIVNDYDLKYQKNNPSYEPTIFTEPVMCNLSQSAQGVLKALITVHVDRYIKDSNIEGEFKFNPSDIEIRLGRIKIKESEVEEE